MQHGHQLLQVSNLVDDVGDNASLLLCTARQGHLNQDGYTDHCVKPSYNTSYSSAVLFNSAVGTMKNTAPKHNIYVFSMKASKLRRNTHPHIFVFFFPFRPTYLCYLASPTICSVSPPLFSEKELGVDSAIPRCVLCVSCTASAICRCQTNITSCEVFM